MTRKQPRIIFFLILSLLSLSTFASAQKASNGIGIRIELGSETEAKVYYARIQGKLGLPLVDASSGNAPIADLDKLLKHFGYAISAADVEGMNSVELTANLQNDALVSRFFAPKIVDYTGTLNEATGEFQNVKFNPGWRKLVRLNTVSGSAAESAGLQSMVILFNYVQTDINLDPFKDQTSKNNQVIITPKQFTPGTDDSAYFLVFDKSPEYKLIFSLQGVAFDLPGFSGGGNYYVPGSCAQCHGHDEFGASPSEPLPFARLNYLDTDHWFDAADYDFPDLVQSNHGILFDGKKDTTTAEFAAAFEILRRLNAEILEQNRKVASGDPGTTPAQDFKTKAVEKWVELHAANNQRVPPIERALVGASGRIWDKNNPDEVELLSRLNRYCFRCHSSIYYNVFDRESLPSLVRIKTVITKPAADRRRMPQGRVLDPAAIQELSEYLTKVTP